MLSDALRTACRPRLAVLVLMTAAGLSGCSNSASPPDTSDAVPEVTQSPDDVPEESAEEPAKPQYAAVVSVQTAPRDSDGSHCASDLPTVGHMRCGPNTSLTDLTSEFVEHRDGKDVYRFDWKLLVDEEPTRQQTVTVAFNGTDDVTVIDAEHFIVMSKGPLNADRDDAP